MIVEIQIPDLSKWLEGFPSYYTNLIFRGNRSSDTFMQRIRASKDIDNRFKHALGDKP